MAEIPNLRAIHEAATPGPWEMAYGGVLSTDPALKSHFVIRLYEDSVGDDNAKAIVIEHNTYAALLDIAEAAKELDDGWNAWMECEDDSVDLPAYQIGLLRGALAKLEEMQ